MYSASRYSNSQLPGHRRTGRQIIGMSGFPHSEICGSRVAHTSPQLIAACHVLHRLYAPRHPRIALTSRLRVHTTNDNAGRLRRGRQLGRAAGRGILVWMILSQPDLNLSGANSVEARVIGTADRLTKQLALPALLKADTIHGIDFKNPFTMSKRAERPNTPRLRAVISCLHPWKIW